MINYPHLNSFTFYIKTTLLFITCILCKNLAYAEDDYRSLIGLKISPISKKEPGHIPKLQLAGSVLLRDKDSCISECGMGYDEGIYDKKYPLLVITKLYQDFTIEITDAIALPPKLIEYGAFNGEIKYYNNRYRLGPCKINGKENENNTSIIGLVRAEPKKKYCGHTSSKISRAWIINADGKILPISTKGVKCYFVTMDECD